MVFEEKVDNLNIVSERLLPTPGEIKAALPLSAKAAETVMKGREAVRAILQKRDRRFLAVVGPCSIHDLDSAKEYAARLTALQERVEDTMLLVMRVYFEKPRTSVGWKGFINDPRLDDSFHIEEGLRKARALLLELAESGLPIGTEALDPITIQYLAELVSWTAIGARTTESQTHREMSSGLSSPIGFKNGTDGNIDVAINALKSAAQPHRFLGINQGGQCTVFHTRGNSDGHVVLRGGNKPNYDAESVAHCEKKLLEAKLPANIMIDCSHGNSLKDYSRQPLVFEEVLKQIEAGNKSIMGWMIESHLEQGRQEIPKNLSELKYGVSVTDACIDWVSTEKLFLDAHTRLPKLTHS